jgi:hypothetical protein
VRLDVAVRHSSQIVHNPVLPKARPPGTSYRSFGTPEVTKLRFASCELCHPRKGEGGRDGKRR